MGNYNPLIWLGYSASSTANTPENHKSPPFALLLYKECEDVSTTNIAIKLAMLETKV